MKKLLFFLTICIGTFSSITYAQGSNDNVYYELRGRPAGQNAVLGIANATNNTSFPVHFIPDYSTGNQYVLELYANGRSTFGKSFYISDRLIADINRHMQSPNTAESINDICMTQASAMQEVFRKGARLEREQLDVLTKTAQSTITINNTNGCNCPNDPDLQKNFDNQQESQGIGGLSDGRYLLVSDQQARANYDYNELQKDPRVKRRWVGRNLVWLIPLAAVLAGVGIAYAKGAFTKTKTVKVYLPGDPNNPDNPDHNPNNRNFNGGSFDQNFSNIALDAAAQFSIGPPRGLIIGLGAFGF